MTSKAETVFEQAAALSSFEKAQLIDKLISSLDAPDSCIDALWAKEAEDRIDAYEKGALEAVSLDAVLQKYR